MTQQSQAITVLPQPPDNGQSGAIHIGPETVDFVSRVVPETSRETVQADAVAILSKGVPPTAAQGTETGLVVGYVQSGKTMSFEAVTALARDNGFQVVVVIGGGSNPLLNQSTGRLRRDFQLDDPSRPRRWLPLVNPKNAGSTLHDLRNVLDDWSDPATPIEYKKTVLITVLKHWGRLGELAQLFKDVGMTGVPTLIIDDEADQASLNNEITQGDESSTYKSVMALRSHLPNHTYLQYTATPQAPLLISIIDTLSPNFVQVLEPGEQYVGGREFFADPLTLARVIPVQDVPTRSNPLSEPPASLLDALRIFMVGVAAGLKKAGPVGNRSMLVHPSQFTIQHQEFYDWVREAFDEWKRILNLADDDPDKQELLQQFQSSHQELRTTVGDSLPAFELIQPLLRLAFRQTSVLQVNAARGKTPQVDWGQSYGWIVVSGQAMDRGFTVEGLTVTYMPRGIGVANADVIQQRARFFGYKRAYLGYCRVFLEQDLLFAFQQYVEHEEDIRKQLFRFQETNRPLNEWKRAFILDTALKPCRKSVMALDYMRGNYADKWVFPSVVMASEDMVQLNREVISEFVSHLDFAEDAGHNDRTVAQRHLIAENVPLLQALEELLLKLRNSNSIDSQKFTGLMLQLKRAIDKATDDNEHEHCVVYQMSPSINRERGVDEGGRVTNLFQGEAPVYPADQRGRVYPGDRAIHSPDCVSIQVHRLKLIPEGPQTDTSFAMNDVPVIAVWVPARLGVGWLAQDES